MICRDNGRRDSPRECGRPEFGEIGKTVGTMMRYKMPIWNCKKLFIMDSDLCVTKGLVDLLKKGIFRSALINNRIYWTEISRVILLIPTLIRRRWSMLMQ